MKNPFKKILNGIFGKLEDYLNRHYPAPPPFPNLIPLAINITTRCNFNCPHCLRDPLDAGKTVQKDIPVALFEEILKGAKKIDYGEITFTGGEPILHPEFGKLVELTCRYGYYYTLVSNGWFYDKYWPIIARNKRCLSMTFSVDGATAEIHDRVRNKPGSFKMVIEAIRFYKDKNILREVGMTTCLTRQNRHQISEIVNLAGDLKVDKLKILTPDYVGGRQDYSLDMKERLEILGEIKKLSPALKKRKIALQLGSVFKLGTPRRVNFCRVLARQHFSIDPDGGMVFCCDLYRLPANRPNVFKDGLEKSFLMTLEAVSEIKKQRLRDIWREKEHPEDFYHCEYCNRHIDSIVEKIRTGGGTLTNECG